MTDNIFVDPLPNQDMTVSTDKADYAPGETVKITAGGFAKGSTITFAIADDPSDFGDDGDRDFYTLSPNPITDGGVADLDGNANGEVVTTWFVPTDNNGTGSGTPDALNGTLILTATGSDGQAATTMFMDALGLTLNQWETITAAWKNGQANPNQATYLEGDVVPYSVEVSGVSTGTIYGIRINMNTYQANTDAGGFVFIDTYDKSISPLPDNFGGASPVADSTFTFSDPLYSQPAGLTFYVTNGDVLSVTYSNSASGLDRFADVTFTANAGTGGNNDKTEIYWGEKLALPNEVRSNANPDNLSKGAAGFTGGSLQTKIEGSGASGPTWITPSNAVQLQPGVVRRGLISGYKWNDTNGNSQWDTGELGLGGWTINLYKDTNNNNTYDQNDTLYSTAVTSNGSQDVNGDGVNDPLGYYEFSSAAQPNEPLLRNDKFFVLEDLQPGWTQTYPTTPNGTPNSMGSNYWGPFTITSNTYEFKGVSGAGSEDPTNAVGNFGNQQFNPSIEVIKTAGDATDGATLTTLAGNVTYSYKVRNMGDVVLSNVTVKDDNGTPGNPSDDFIVGTIASLAVGTSQTLTSTRSITTDTTNIATATGTTPINGTVSDTDNAVVDVIAPSIEVIKTAGDATDGATLTTLAGNVTYSYKVSNTGDVVLSNVTVKDDNGTPGNPSDDFIVGTIASLAVGTSQTLTSTRSITTDTTNIATATGTTPINDTVSDTDNAVVDVIAPSIEVIKTAGDATDGATLTTLAGNVTYSYKVSNTGDVVLSNVTVKDDNGTPGNPSDDFIVGTIASLAVGTSQTLTSTRSITTDTTNIATATGTTPINGTVSDTDNAVVDVIAPSIEVIKTAGDATDGATLTTLAGNVTYSYKVSNTGDVVLSNVTVKDDNGTPGNPSDDFIVGTIASLAVGTSQTLTSTRSITTDTTNIATATGTTPINDTVSDTDNAVVDVIAPSIEVIKTAGDATDGATLTTLAGNVTYSYKVSNTGDVVLSNVTVKDDNGTPGNPSDDFIVGTIASLAVGTSQTLTSTRSITTDTTNIATATGTTPINDTVSDTDNAVVDVIAPSIEVIKTAGDATDGATLTTLAGNVTYSYKVSNTGDVVLSNVTVKDDNGTPGNPSDDFIVGTIASLAVGTSQTLTSTRSITTDTTNIATATGTTPINDTVSDTDNAVVDVIAPSIEVIKTAGDATDGATLTTLAGNVTYSYKVSNTGDVVLSNVTVKDDNGTPGNPSDDFIVGTIASLAVGTSQTLTSTRSITTDTTNIATATGTTPINGTVSDTDNAVVDVIAPSIEVIKTAGDATDGATLTTLAGNVTYSYKVSNTGDVVLSNVTVKDDNGTPGNPSDDFIVGTIASLAVGTSQTLTSTRSITTDTTNIATATGTTPINGTVSDTDNAVVDVIAPSIEVIKTAGDATDGATLTTLAGNVTYSYKVSNTGDVVLSNVTVKDDNGTPGNPSDDFIVGTIASLAVGTSQTLTSTRSITTDTTNIATATGTTPINGTVSDTDNAVVDVIARTGDLKITKTDYLTKVVPGQCVTYTIVVSNCGPDTATHALVEDLFPSNLTDVKWTSKAAKGATDNKARGTDNIEDYVTLPAGSSITYKVTGTVVGGPASHKVSDYHRTLTNTATVTAPSDFTDTNLENNTATDIDTIMAAPGVHNAHFWQNTKWQKSWDGIQGNEHSQKTRPNFPDSDLLLSPYTNSARSGKVLDPITRRYGVGLLIGDYNHNGKTDKKENTLFYTRAQALQIVDSSMHPNNRDTRYILGRDLVTSWLNYLAGNSIDTPNSKDQDARDYINEGIHWLQALTPDQNRDGKGDGYLQGLTGNETSNSRTPQILARSSYWKSGISSASNLPNSYKSNTDVLYPIDAGITIHTHLDNYNNNIF